MQDPTRCYLCGDHLPNHDPQCPQYIYDEMASFGHVDQAAFIPLEKHIGEAGCEEVEVDDAKVQGILMRRKEVMETHGAGAQVVAPYKPNRKQRRCQAHAKKAAKSKPTKKRRW